MKEPLNRDIPPYHLLPYHLPVKDTFIHYFTKILHFGTNAKNEYDDYIKKNLHLINECGNVFDEELDHNYVANSYLLKLALNMLRDYVDSIPKDENKSKIFEYDKIQIKK